MTVCDYCGLDYANDGHAENCGEYLNDADSPLLEDGTVVGNISEYVAARKAADRIGETYELLTHVPDPVVAGGFNLSTDDMTAWSRWPEIVAYANAHDLTVAAAVQALVNAGLSHQ